MLGLLGGRESVLPVVSWARFEAFRVGADLSGCSASCGTDSRGPPSAMPSPDGALKVSSPALQVIAMSSAIHLSRLLWSFLLCLALLVYLCRSNMCEFVSRYF